MKKPADGNGGGSPRLLDLDAAAAYSGIAYWSLRRLVASGTIPIVRLPAPGATDGRAMRRILIDRGDLDQLIERFKERLEG